MRTTRFSDGSPISYSPQSSVWATSEKQSGYAIRCIRDVVLGVEVGSLNYLHVFPNPVIDYLFIAELNQLGTVKQGTIQIFDINGRLLLDIPYSTGAIDVSKLPQGFYQLVFQNAQTRSTINLIKE